MNQIERGRALLRLTESEDFSIVAAELDKRIERLAEIRDMQASYTPGDQQALVIAAHRHNELWSLKEWIADEIELGAMEHAKREAHK